MEIDEGVAYLRALKQSAGPVAETATAADSGDRFKGAEKRRSPRYKCEGSAEMCEAGRDIRTWATATSGWGLPSWRCRTRTSLDCAHCWPPSPDRL